MRTAPKLLVAALMALGSGGAASAGADEPGPDWMPAEQVRQKLMDSGYTSISELEADDGHWEGEGVKNGVKMEFHVNAMTGEITKEKPDRD